MPNFYKKTLARISSDLRLSPNNSFLTDKSFAVSKKMGLFSLPLSVVVRNCLIKNMK